MNLGAFAVVAAIQRRPGVTSNLSTFAGLGRREPWLAILMTLFLLSLTGIPPTAGFFAKVYVILAAVQAGGRLDVVRSSPSSRCSTRPRPRSTTCASSSTCSCATRRPSSRRSPHGRLVWTGLLVATVLDHRARPLPERHARDRRGRRPGGHPARGLGPRPGRDRRAQSDPRSFRHVAVIHSPVPGDRPQSGPYAKATPITGVAVRVRSSGFCHVSAGGR